MTSTPTAPQRPLRKDAERSRRRVLDTAAKLFAERGLDVGFDEIARVAGVGVGTVYRRFPRREALVEALFVEKLRKLADLAATAAAMADPWSAVVWFCEQSIHEQQQDLGLGQVIIGKVEVSDALARERDRLPSMVGAVVARAQRSGDVRPDLVTADLVLMLHLIGRIGGAGEHAGDVTRRCLALLLDSIRVQPPGRASLPAPEPTMEVFAAIAARL